jgi:hypothetical protein
MTISTLTNVAAVNAAFSKNPPDLPAPILLLAKISCAGRS